MEHGGSYERDAAIGGYDRKELRGLSKQAKRGTLTQRERARYKYLKDERGGRRKRGLLAGLGGVGATLAALAAAGKLGGGEGEGKDRARALMESIRGRLAKGKVNAKDKLELLNDKRLARKLGVDPREYVDDSPASAVTEDISSDMQLPPELRDTPGADIVANSMDEARRNQIRATNERNDQYVTDQAAINAARLARIESEESAVSAANDGGDPLRRRISNTGDRVVDEAATPEYSNSPNNINEATGLKSRSVDLGSDFPARTITDREQALLDRDVDNSFKDEDQDIFGLSVSDMLEAGMTPEEIGAEKAGSPRQKYPMPEGPVARRGTSPLVPGPQATNLSQRLVRQAGARSEMEPDANQYPSPNRAGEVPTQLKKNDTEALMKVLESKEGYRGAPPATQALLLKIHNDQREISGLEPVETLSSASEQDLIEAVKRAEALSSHQASKSLHFRSLPGGPRGSQSGPRTMSTTAQILNRYN